MRKKKPLRQLAQTLPFEAGNARGIEPVKITTHSGPVAPASELTACGVGPRNQLSSARRQSQKGRLHDRMIDHYAASATRRTRAMAKYL